MESPYRNCHCWGEDSNHQMTASGSFPLLSFFAGRRKKSANTNSSLNRALHRVALNMIQKYRRVANNCLYGALVNLVPIAFFKASDVLNSENIAAVLISVELVLILVFLWAHGKSKGHSGLWVLLSILSYGLLAIDDKYPHAADREQKQHKNLATYTFVMIGIACLIYVVYTIRTTR